MTLILVLICVSACICFVYGAVLFLQYNTNLFNNIEWSPYKDYLEALKKNYEKEHLSFSGEKIEM